MFGFLGFMAVLLAPIFPISYWISWDLQDKRDRSSFATTVWRDFVALVERCAAGVRNGQKQWRAALDAYTKPGPAKRTDAMQPRSNSA
jgi:hypothetical protein